MMTRLGGRIGFARGLSLFLVFLFLTGLGVQTTGIRSAVANSGISLDANGDALVPCGALGSFTVDNYRVTGHSSCLGSVSIPEGVTSIAARSMQYINPLTSLTLPSTLRSIGSYAFYYSDGFVSLTVPSSVTTIEGYAFSRSSSLERVTFLGNAPSGGSRIFRNVGPGPIAIISPSATGFGAEGAQWDELTVAVLRTAVFEANLGSGSMADQTGVLSAGLDANQFCRSGYAFDRWATSPDGSGDSYSDRASYNFSADVTLFAQWLPSFTVTFDPNSGTGSMCTQGSLSPSTLISNTFTKPGMGVSSWNTVADGSGDSFGINAVYDFSADVTLYAQWTPLRTVTFDANGGSGYMLPDVDVEPTRLPANTFTRAGFIFAGWNASADGGGVGYVDAATGVNADVTLYAQWRAVVVTFDPNGGIGSAGSFAFGERASPRSRSWFTRSGYRFSGWNTAANGTGTSHSEWMDNNFLSDITLYAQWDTQIDCSVSGSFIVINNVVSGGAWPYGNCSGHAEIPEGVTGIAADAFSTVNGGGNLTSVGFPSTLTSIGQKAFRRASLTSAVTIPSTVTSIGTETFWESTVPEVHFAAGSPITQIPAGFLREAQSLTAFTFPSGVTSIADYAFENTHYLQHIEIPATVLTIGESAYEYAGIRTSATLTFEKPSSLTTIGYFGFGRMMSIESVEIPNSVITIDSYAFLFMTSLTSLTFETPSRVETIRGSAFSFLYSLETISIPPSVKYMGGAIARMSQLREITFEDPTLLVSANPVTQELVYQWAPAANGPVTVNYCGDNSKLGTLEAGVTIRCDRTVSFDSNGGVGSLSSQTNYAASALSSNTFTKSGFRFMEWNTAANGSGTSYADGGSYGFSADVTLYAQWLATYSAISGDGYVDCGTSGTFTIASNTVTGNSSCVGSVVVPPGVTAMGASSFKNATGITSVTLPAGVTTIGSYAFQTTTSMVSINIPTTVISIGVSAFYNATALSSISLPDSVTTLGNGAFRRTLAMTTLTLGTGITSIPVSAFQESGVTSVVIPDSVTSVGGSAFYRANALESVVIGEGVTLIDSMAFMDASALQSVTLGTRVASIGVSAFANTDIGSVTLPQSLTTIDNSAFSNTPLSSITIPSEVTRIGDSAFTGATNITSLSIPDGVTTLGASAFAGMTSLTSVRIGSGVTTIPSDAFRNTGLRTITIPAGITAINSNAFADLSLLWVAFEANAPASVSDTSFANAPAGARAIVSPVASGFGLNGASWKGLSVDVQATVTFERNEGIGAMLSQRSSSSAALSNSTFVRPGYRFAGWNTQADGQGAKYLNQGLFEFSANATLYAQWVRIPAAVAAANNAVIAGVAPLAVVVRPQGIFTPVVASAERRATPQKFSRTPGPRSGASAVAMIDGEEVVVSAESTGPRNARYSAGKFTLDIGVAQSDGSVTNEGGAPALKVARGQAAEVKGGGLRPQSLLQVFLPSSDGSFLELPSVTVAEDGSFVGTLTVGMGSREKPLPIGKRFLQMVGIDEDGNDTVLDVPITVAQPLPAPEVNRLSGVRPALVPGQLVALNAGAPEVVELSTAPGAALVSGEGWAFGVTGGAQSEDSEALAFSRDAPVTFSGEGFMPGTRADVWLFSDPILLGTVNIADDGTFVADFAVDSNFVPTGDHTLQIQGVGDDGYVRAASLGVVVDDLAATPVAAVPQSPLDWIPLTLMLTSLGGLAALVGIALAVRRRGVPRPVRVPALG
ncbi:MAG: leucine-rich repeat protein [Microbacteriaceae bacterium]|nr:leucine-rich repeat protein [Microbacteriaceae bacterium]